MHAQGEDKLLSTQARAASGEIVTLPKARERQGSSSITLFPSSPPTARPARTLRVCVCVGTHWLASAPTVSTDWPPCPR